MSSCKTSDATKREPRDCDTQAGWVEPCQRPHIHYGAAITFALLAYLVDPFQWKAVTLQASQDIAYRALIGLHYSTENRKRISVVLFNEKTLEHLKSTWPVRLGTHAAVLKEIRKFGPEAVVVDFIFPDERDDKTLETLEKEIAAYEDDSIDLYFARAEKVDVDWIRSDLPTARLTSVIKPAGEAVSRTYEPCSRFPEDRSTCACIVRRNHFIACPEGSRAGPPSLPAALNVAFELFGTKDLPHWFDVGRPVPIEVVWSNRRNNGNDIWMLKETAVEQNKLCVDLTAGFWDWLRRVFLPEEEYSFRQTCPFTTTVPVHGLLSAPDDPLLEYFIKDRFVFYGGDLAGLEDTVVPPTHVKLPGVYLHAMALDNLLTFEGDYKRSDLLLPAIRLSAHDFGIAVSVLLAVAVVAFARGLRAFEPYMPSRWYCATILEFFAWLSFMLAILIAIVAMCFALYIWLAISPKNWLGYGGLALSLIALNRSPVPGALCVGLCRHVLPWLKTKIPEKGGAIMRLLLLFTAFILALSAAAVGAGPEKITEIKLKPLPTFAAANLESDRRDLDAAALDEQPPPWTILEASDNGMYLVEFKGSRLWVLDSTVTVDNTAKASAFVPEAINMDDPEVGSIRGYGD